MRVNEFADISLYYYQIPKSKIKLIIKISVISVPRQISLYFIPRIHCLISSTPSACTTVRASSGIAVPGSTLFMR